MTIFRAAAVAATLLASATMLGSPVAAASRTVPITVPLSARPIQPVAWSAADETFNDHRWDRHRGHHGGFDGGDLLGVVLIGGGIAAVVAAIGKDRQERRSDRTDGRDYPGAGDRTDGRDYPQAGDRSYEYRSDGTRKPDQDYRGSGDASGADRANDYRDRSDAADRQSGQDDQRETDRAVDACSAEAARSGKVDEIFEVEKIDGEWRVKGDYTNGREFTCSVDGDGKAYVGQRDQADNHATDGADDRYATGRSPDFTDPRGR